MLKLVQSSCHHYILRVLGNFLGKKYQSMFWRVSKLFSGVCQNRVLRVQMNILKQTSFSEEKRSYLLWISCDESLFFCWKKIGGYKKTAFYLSIGTSSSESIFLKKIFFELSDIALKSYRFFSQLFGRVFHNCVLCVHKNILKQTIFFQKNFFWSSLVFAWHFFVYLLRKSMELSTAHSTFP